MDPGNPNLTILNLQQTQEACSNEYQFDRWVKDELE